MKRILLSFFALTLFVNFSFAQTPVDIDAEDKMGEPVKKDIIDHINSRSNMIWLDGIKLFYGTLAFGYERFNEKSTKSIRIPLAYSFTKNFVETGFELRYFVKSWEPRNYGFDQNNPWYGVRSIFFGPSTYFLYGADNLLTAVALSGGGQVQLVSGFNTSISAFGGPGAVFLDGTPRNKPYAYFYWGVQVTAGYRF